MYQNIHFDRKNQEIHIWDDKKGYSKERFVRYAYMKDPNGEYESIYGDKLKRIGSWERGSEDKLFESDVNPSIRYLIDNYLDSDEPSEGHTILTYDIEVEMHSGLPNPQIATNEITSIAYHDSVTGERGVFVVSDKIIDKTISGANVRSFRDEEDLLLAFVHKWEEINPTIITGWNSDFFDTNYLYNRLVNVFGKKVANRLSPIGVVSWNKYRERYFIAGVSSLDYLALYKNFTYTELPNYRLDTIAQLELGRGKIEYEGNLDQLFRDDIEKFIEYNLVDVELVVELDEKLQFIDLARAVCHAGHVPYEDFLFSSKWLEGAILTFLKRSDRVATNRPPRFEKNEEGKFTGAYVKPPIPGLYKWIYDLDLTSLYPSIIMSINISPETKMGKIENFSSEGFMSNTIDSYTFCDVDGDEYPTMDRDKFNSFLEKTGYSVASNGVLYRQDKVGVIPEILDVWFNKRVEYKDLMKKFGKAGDDNKYKFYHQRQLVQKIMLNSLYGVLGLPSFRFYDIDNAEGVTLTGQTVIKTTEKIANSYYSKNIGVEKDYNIYVDTDSVFYEAAPLVKSRNPSIDENDDEQMTKAILEVAREVQDHINKVYDTMSKKMFNVDTHKFDIKQETIAKSGFWVSKKRYAQWIINDNTVPCDKLDVKGLDVKRSSFPKYFKTVMKDVLWDIMKDIPKSDIDTMILNFKDSMSKRPFLDIARNSAVKNISEYTNKDNILGKHDKGTPAHVKSAINYNMLLKHYGVDTKFERIKNGDKIKWVYLKDNPLGIESVAATGYKDPKQILDLIETYIDYDRIWERELQKKLDDFYNAMNWDKPNPNAEKASQFFGF